MAPYEISSRSSSTSFKKSSKHGSDEEKTKETSRSHSPNKGKGKKPDKQKPSFLKSIFTRDYLPTTSTMAPSAAFRDKSKAPVSMMNSNMFRDERTSSRSSKPQITKNEKPKNEKHESEKTKEEQKRSKKPPPEDESDEEPDLDDFKSKYTPPADQEKEKEEKEIESSRKELPSPSKKEVSKDKKHENPAGPSSKTKTTFKTAFTSKHDIEMAKRQIKFASLHGDELKEQEAWAAEKLQAHAGTCPAGLTWHRYTEDRTPNHPHMDGYRCLGTGHFVSHELIAEGKGGVYEKNSGFIKHDSMLAVREALGLPTLPAYAGIRWNGPFYGERPNGGIIRAGGLEDEDGDPNVKWW